jgi:hypothetical protein
VRLAPIFKAAICLSSIPALENQQSNQEYDRRDNDENDIEVDLADLGTDADPYGPHPIGIVQRAVVDVSCKHGNEEGGDWKRCEQSCKIKKRARSGPNQPKHRDFGHGSRQIPKCLLDYVKSRMPCPQGIRGMCSIEVNEERRNALTGSYGRHHKAGEEWR